MTVTPIHSGQSEPTLDELVATLAQMRMVEKNAKERADAVAQQIRERVQVDGQQQVGVYTLTLTPQKRFDVDRARAILTPEQQEMCTVSTIVAAQAKKVLPPVLYEACQIEHGVRKVGVTRDV